jgi:hypothetical protein
MPDWLIATLLRPFVLLLLGAWVLYPARVAVIRHMPEGRLKRLLLIRIS